MEFEDQEEEEIGLPASYDSLGHASRVVAEANKSGPSNKKLANRYGECLKNHAVGIGGHAVDGCCEFMPAGEEGTLDALKCAACNCHRNFHRKETEGGDPFHYQYSPYYRTHGGYLHVAGQHRLPPTTATAPLALPSTSGGGGGHSREDQEDVTNPNAAGKKRYRTKFSQEQKDKMLEFAEKVGWRIQKHDEAAVQQFCTETCVKRHVLKVWMHNNKHTLGKKP